MNKKHPMLTRSEREGEREKESQGDGEEGRVAGRGRESGIKQLSASPQLYDRPLSPPRPPALANEHEGKFLTLKASKFVRTSGQVVWKASGRSANYVSFDLTTTPPPPFPSPLYCLILCFILSFIFLLLFFLRLFFLLVHLPLFPFPPLFSSTSSFSFILRLFPLLSFSSSSHSFPFFPSPPLPFLSCTFCFTFCPFPPLPVPFPFFPLFPFPSSSSCFLSFIFLTFPFSLTHVSSPCTVKTPTRN